MERAKRTREMKAGGGECKGRREGEKQFFSLFFSLKFAHCGPTGLRWLLAISELTKLLRIDFIFRVQPSIPRVAKV